jgi:hypothetical protein
MLSEEGGRGSRTLRHFMLLAVALSLGAVLGGCSDSGGPSGDASGGTLKLAELPDPCAWINAEEAGRLLGLAGQPQQTPMGDATSVGRSCVFTNGDNTIWLNVSYQGLNPQVFDARGQSTEELIELASTQYADQLQHLETSETGRYPTLAFGDAGQTILVVFTNIGKARDLPEGISERLSFSSIYTITLWMTAPDLTQEQRLAALHSLVERPVQQLKERAST